MTSSRTKKAVDEIAELTGARISEDHLFLESIVTSNARLKLAISKADGRVEVNRIPASFLWAHLMLPCVLIPISIIAYAEAQKGNPADAIQAMIVAVMVIASGYGFIAWVNRKAIRENPVLSYDLKKKLLIAGPQKRRINRDTILCVIALASVPRRANKPSTRSELKLVYRTDTSTGSDSVNIARNSKPYLPAYDDEITPFVRGLKIPYIHVTRDIVGRDFEIERIA